MSASGSRSSAEPNTQRRSRSLRSAALRRIRPTFFRKAAGSAIVLSSGWMISPTSSRSPVPHRRRFTGCSASGTPPSCGSPGRTASAPFHLLPSGISPAQARWATSLRGEELKKGGSIRRRAVGATGEAAGQRQCDHRGADQDPRGYEARCAAARPSTEESVNLSQMAAQLRRFARGCSRKRHAPEEVVAKLRQVQALTPQGRPMAGVVCSLIEAAG